MFKKERLKCPTNTVNMHIRFTQIIMERVRCRLSSDSEGVTAERGALCE